MRKETRIAFTAYVSQIALLNGVEAAEVTGTKFTVAPNVEQKLEEKIQESSEFLNSISVVMVPAQVGEKVGIGATRPIASRTNTKAGDRRTPTDPTDTWPVVMPIATDVPRIRRLRYICNAARTPRMLGEESVKATSPKASIMTVPLSSVINWRILPRNFATDFIIIRQMSCRLVRDFFRASTESKSCSGNRRNSVVTSRYSASHCAWPWLRRGSTTMGM